MRVAEASARIDAPIERVWQVMLDLSRYGEWNPFVVKVDADGPARVGSRLVLHVRWPGGGGATSGELCTRVDAPSAGRASFEYAFTGVLARVGAVRAIRVQRLETDGGGTRYHTREEFRGWLTWALPLAKVQAGFDAQALALKSRAER